MAQEARGPLIPSPPYHQNKMFKHSFIATESDDIYVGKILHLHQNAPAYKQHTFHIDFDQILIQYQ